MKKQLLTLSLFVMSIGLFSQSTMWLPHNANFDTLWAPRWMSVVDTNVVWAVGLNGSHTTAVSNRFTRTQNGNTFTPGVYMAASDTFYYNSANISAVNDSVAYIPCYFIPGTGRSGYVRKTMDRGLTWTICTDTLTMFATSANFPDWAHFYTNNFGIVLGDPNGGNFEIYHTHDGGTSWLRVPNVNIPAPGANEYGLTDSYTTYGKKHVWFGTGHASSALNHVYRSNDTGHTWLSSTIPGMNGGVNGLAFRDSLNGLAWGLTATASGKFVVERTSNGGANWSVVYQRDKVGTSDISVVPGRNAYMSVGLDSSSSLGTGVVGNGIMTSVTYDDGMNWTILESAPGGTGPIPNTFRMIKVTMLDSVHGWGGCFSDTSNKPFGNSGMAKWAGPKINLACPIFVSGIANICSGSVATLTASGAANYLWMPGSATTNTVSVSPATSTVYTVATAISGCMNMATFSLTVVPTPTAGVTAAGAVDTIYNANCGTAPTSATLTATGGATYSWLPGTGLSSTTNTVVTATPATTTNYTLTAHNGACINAMPISLTVVNCAGINQLTVNGTQIAFYPNPSNGIVSVNASNIKAGTVITISDLLGNEVYKTSMNANSLNQNFNIDLSSLSKGVYLFGVSNGNQVQVQKMIIQ